MTDRKQALREELEQRRQRLLALAGRMSPADWERPVQSEDERWTAHQLLAHLLTTETGQLTALKGIAEGGPGVREDFDLDRWNRKQVQREGPRPVDDLLAALAASRRDVLAALDTMTEEQLARRGRHGTGVVYTVAEIFERIARHEYDHVVAMEEALASESAAQSPKSEVGRPDS